MRFDGKLEKWNDDRGFGFISPLHGGEPVFVHISAFARDGRRPRIGEALSFEVEPARDGKKRAVNVQRAVSHATSVRKAQSKRDAAERGGILVLLKRAAFALVLIAVASFAYNKFGSDRAAQDVSKAAESPASTAQFRCDGRTRCSQMTSCEEATFFLKNCPGTQMDGDRDGVPCEKQWCGRR